MSDSAPAPAVASPAPTVSAPQPAGPAASAAPSPARTPIAVVVQAEDVGTLQSRRLSIPVDRVTAPMLRDTFGDPRTMGAHEALDIGAPMRTPVRAVEDGTVARLFTSERGGLTVYQYDPTRRFAYYYAHLDGYAPGLREGQPVRRCELIGWVGITGNSPAGAPHLHFAIFKLESEPRWWRGAPVNPFVVFARAAEPSAPCPPGSGSG